VIVLQETSPAYWHKRILDRSKVKFQLTTREADTLQQLLKGETNKEIATALKVSEQTVKEHIKHLLAKTGIKTRTGIVMKAVLCGLQYGSSMVPPDSSRYACVASSSQVDSQPYNPPFEAPGPYRRSRNAEKIPVIPRQEIDLVSSASHTASA
jgi:DNA-binding CsgD family transcriptional regulator